MSTEAEPHTYQGLAIADGVAIGKAKIADTGHFPSRVPRYRIDPDDVQKESKRLDRACQTAREELQELAEKTEERLGQREADLMRAQALMVEDAAFRAEIEELIIEEHLNAEAALSEVVERFGKLVADIDDPYLRERSSDIQDVGQRILGKLLFVEGDISPQLAEPSVVLAAQLAPSLTVKLDSRMLLGFATEHGGETSHGAILARSLGIPAVSGLTGIVSQVLDGEQIIVDGFKGLVIVRPDQEQLEEYTERAAEFRDRRLSLIEHSCELALTQDGVRIQVLANLARPQESEMAREYGAEGIGLYRTEVEYLTHSSLPSEDDLYEEYAEVAEMFGKQGVAFRALDIGGDKFPPSVPLAHEENPFIGMRGLRLLLEHVKDLMLPQLRALIRASAHGKVRIMYPMIASVGDMDAAFELFERAREQVLEAGHPTGERIDQGIMIEVPSAIPMLPELMEKADFASVGTNDLVQYLLAADRNSDRMARAYEPFHPAVVRTLETIYRAGEGAGTEVGVCGEVASDPDFLPLLVGMGYRKVSANVGAVPNVKRLVGEIAVEKCEELVREAARARTAEQIRSAAREFGSQCRQPA